MDTIRIRGARTHNLCNIDLDLPRDRLIVITGLSGSGKSSLAFDTIYAEGQRRYVESLSAYARQFLSMMEKPDVDHIEGLSPAIAIEQKSTSHNPRSTVGTITEIHDYLRLLFARAGTPRCPTHGTTLEARTISQMVDVVLELSGDTRWLLLAPVVAGRKGEHVQVFEQLQRQGYLRVIVDGAMYELDAVPPLAPKKKHDIDVVVDRFKVREDIRLRLTESFENAIALGEGIARVRAQTEGGVSAGDDLLFSARFACPHCGYSINELEPRLFSFNNPAGACAKCDGLGVIQFFDPDRVVQRPQLSLSAGAVRGWDRRNAYYFHLISSLARHYDFDLDTPFAELSQAIRDVLLHGSGREQIEFEYEFADGGHRRRKHVFEGILPTMERRYRETDSAMVREELARYLGSKPCPECHGARLNEAARHVFIGEVNLPAVSAMAIAQAHAYFGELVLPGHRREIGERILREVRDRLQFLVNVGLEYLTLDRSAETLSGGEAQRIRLASQIGAGLVGVMYVLDEPTIGLHQRDNERLLSTLVRLRDIGNTVIIVEHDEEAIRLADHVVDMGPGAGVHGGRVVSAGTPRQIAQCSESLTGQYLSGHRRIALPEERRPFDPAKVLRITGARGNNLKGVTAELPVGLFTCITGVSGSGKSTLINDTLFPLLARELHRSAVEVAPFEGCEGLEHFDKVVDIDQSPIGRTPRSNPATYTGLFTPIRELFAGTADARSRGSPP
ncbi:MAG: excinuclease ABC subunit UvrA, partial [Gammaproteobacteria bacterium]|nr:excinuclease ABC subunit UvrA [Gammaproteobacteria bacterium]